MDTLIETSKTQLISKNVSENHTNHSTFAVLFELFINLNVILIINAASLVIIYRLNSSFAQF
jgi:hypothetical protein